MNTCPACLAATAKKVEAITSDVLWYYGCSACEHIWMVKKGDPDGPILTFTRKPAGK